MLGRRRTREVYRVYGEGEVPDREDWSESEPPTRMYDEDHLPSVEYSESELPTRELGEPAPEPSEEHRHEPVPARPCARRRALRRVAVMTLLGAGVGVVAALALHSLSASTGRERRGEGGAASLPPHALPVPIAGAPARAPAQGTISAPHAGSSLRGTGGGSVRGAGGARILAREGSKGMGQRGALARNERGGALRDASAAGREMAAYPPEHRAAAHLFASALPYGSQPSSPAAGHASEGVPAEAQPSEFGFEG
jgi:hypothetical protein